MPVINKLGCNQAECHGSRKGKGGFGFSMTIRIPKSAMLL
jgi:hypothetical protein